MKGNGLGPWPSPLCFGFFTDKNGDTYLSCKIIVRDESWEVLGTCASDFFCLPGWSLALGGGSGRINGFLMQN